MCVDVFPETIMSSKVLIRTIHMLMFIYQYGVFIDVLSEARLTLLHSTTYLL